MIYKNLLYELSKGQNGSSTPDAVEINVPSNARFYQVDLATRTIDAPKYLSVQQEHRAETVYFLVDRYYDNVDLSQTTCIVNFINADNQAYIYYVPFCDVYLFDGKMILPWNISGAATAKPGKVQYSLTFYRMENIVNPSDLDITENLGKLTYKLSTQMAQSEVMYGLNLEDLIVLEDQNDENYDYTNDLKLLQTILASIGQSYEEAVVYWTDV